MWSCFYLPISVDVCILVNDWEVGEPSVVIVWWEDAIDNGCVVINSCGVVTDVVTDVVYLTSFDVIASVEAVWLVVGCWEVDGIPADVTFDGVEDWEVVNSTSSDVITSLLTVWVVDGYCEVVGILAVVTFDRVEGREVIAFCDVVDSLVVMPSEADVVIFWLDVSSCSVVDWTSDDVGVWDVNGNVVCIDVTSVAVAVVDTTIIEKIRVRHSTRAIHLSNDLGLWLNVSASITQNQEGCPNSRVV